jgi:two-component system LytT family response regulator
MISAVIIDDEEHCIRRLTGLLAEHCGERVSVLGSFRSADDGMLGIQRLSPQLVFLDVQMPGKSGFDMLKSLGNIHFDVIFTTAYEKYALNAFKFSAMDFLLKPIEREELVPAIEKFSKRRPYLEEAGKMDVLLHNLTQSRDKSKRISIPTISGFAFVRVADIIRCESSINYTTVILRDKQKITVAKTLKEFEQLLAEHDFFRVHNSHLVNLDYIESYHKGKGGWLVMSDGSKIEVSVRRKDALLKRLKNS